jgi:hypothetical protein
MTTHYLAAADGLSICIAVQAPDRRFSDGNAPINEVRGFIIGMGFK